MSENDSVIIFRTASDLSHKELVVECTKTRGTWYFKQPKGAEWMYAVIYDYTDGLQIKYIYNKRGMWQYDYFTARVTDLREGHYNRWHGRATLSKLKEEPKTRSFTFEFTNSDRLNLWVHGVGEFIQSTEFELCPAPTSIVVAGITLTSCCIDALKKLNALPGLANKVDMISLISDLAGIVDAAEAIPKALNSLTQKAAGGPSLSGLLSPTIKLKMREIFIQKLADHGSSPQRKFWEQVGKAWQIDM